MINMIMFTQAKLIIIGIAVALILSTAGGAYWYYSWSQKEITVLRSNNVKLTLAVSTNEDTIAALQADSAKISTTITQVSEQFELARSENNVLRTKLANHDIGFLASKKPGLVQGIINKGVIDSGRCLEILSGAALTEDEKSATKKSQTNSSCPTIANPLYKVKK
jgi:hypothetical protein